MDDVRGEPGNALPAPGGLLGRLAALHDALFAPAREQWIGRNLLRLALLGFFVHLLLILANRLLPAPPTLVALAGTSFLAALYTPFSLILVYEVFELIRTVPDSMTRSNGKEFEIVSLIVLRSAFKDIAELDSPTALAEQTETVQAVLLDMFGGLAMFLLVAVFYHVARGIRMQAVEDEANDPARLARFVALKKAIAAGLAFLLGGYALWSLGAWAVDVYRVAYTGAAPALDVNTLFYAEFFTAMIFADVAILIVSMQFSDRYELVFRNAGFVAASVLIRLSLLADRPYRVAFGILAIAFGVLTLLVYRYRVKTSRPQSG